MKKTAWILSAILFWAVRSTAQTAIEFIPTAGYTFASHDPFDYNYYGRIGDGLNLGGSLKFNVTRSVGIELLYSHLGTHSGVFEYGYPHTEAYAYPDTYDHLNVDYIMIGPVESFNIPNSTVRPFVGALLGAAILSPDYVGSTTKFAVGVELGTNIYVTPRVGIQLKAQMLSPVDAEDGGFYVGPGGGATFGTYSSYYQFSLNAGVIIGLGPILHEPVNRGYNRRPGPRHYRYYY